MPSDVQQKPGYARITEESDLSLEIIMLLVLGVLMLVFGVLLFKIHTGALPYNADATYGLFLVIVSFQAITMGRTPFGDLRRSWALVIIGIGTAILGMIACFIPGTLTGLVRTLVGIVLFAGGITLLLQLVFSEKKARTWMRIPGIPRQLTIACGLVYVLTISQGLITLLPGITTARETAILLIAYAMSFFYLSWCIRTATAAYPPEKRGDSTSNGQAPDGAGSKRRGGLLQEASLPLMPALLILLGILLALFGLLLVPIGLRLLPFSPDGQLGVILTVMAIQMMALGDTPMGQYTRSLLVIFIGIVFAALGFVSCIVPGLLTDVIRILLGLLNLIGGAVLLIKRFLPILRDIRTPPLAPVVVPPIVKRLMATLTLLNIVAIAFGLSTLVPGLLPELLAPGILVLNGIVLFILASILQKLAGLQAG